MVCVITSICRGLSSRLLSALCCYFKLSQDSSSRGSLTYGYGRPLKKHGHARQPARLPARPLARSPVNESRIYLC